MTYCREGRDLRKDNEGEAHNNEERGGERGMKDRGLRWEVSERGSRSWSTSRPPTRVRHPSELTSSVKSSISNIAERSGNIPEANTNRTLAEMSKLYSNGRFSVRLAMNG